jgi:hypothetical protein
MLRAPGTGFTPLTDAILIDDARRDIESAHKKRRIVVGPLWLCAFHDSPAATYGVSLRGSRMRGSPPITAPTFASGNPVRVVDIISREAVFAGGCHLPKQRL